MVHTYQPKSILCPQNRIKLVPFDYDDCVIPNIYISHPTYVPILSWLVGEIEISKFSIHIWVLTLFAGLVAPFGGFFASAVKRGMNIKDFANLIPGHGGMLDRLDCLMLMMIFTYVYLQEIVKLRSSNLELLWYQVDHLPVAAKVELLKRLGVTLSNDWNNTL